MPEQTDLTQIKVDGVLTVPDGTDLNLVQSMLLSVGHTWEGNI